MSVATTSRAASPALRSLLTGRQSLIQGPLRPASSFCSSSVSARLHQQRRWAQVHDVRFLVTTQAPRHVLERYREKLDRKARNEGHGDIEGLKEAYADEIQTQRRRDAIAVPGLDRVLGGEGEEEITVDTTTTTSQEQHSPPGSRSDQPTAAAARQNPTPQTSPATSTAPPSHQQPQPQSQVKPLSAILDLPKAALLPVSELTAIWRLHHASSSPHSLCAVIPAPTYAAMETLARVRPQFVLPVPHPSQGGAEIHFLQWTFDAASRTSTVLFTQLAEFKARGEFAQPHTTVTHHVDFAAEKGVVLMQGAVVENRGVKMADAQFLVMCLQRFYGGWDAASAGGVAGEVAAAAAGAAGAAAVADGRAAERRRLLEWFSTGDARFSIEKLMEETEKLA